MDTLSGGADEEEKEEKSGDELAAARAAAVVLFFHHVSVPVPLWDKLLYVKVRTSVYLDVGYTFSQWSGSSIPWTVTSDCEVDQFLNLSITWYFKNLLSSQGESTHKGRNNKRSTKPTVTLPPRIACCPVAGTTSLIISYRAEKYFLFCFERK